MPALADSTCLLTFDLGGSGLRAGIVDANGGVLATRRAGDAIAVDSNGGSQADPDRWWDTLVELTDAFAGTDEEAFTRIGAIAISGITRTQVFITRSRGSPGYTSRNRTRSPRSRPCSNRKTG